MDSEQASNTTVLSMKHIPGLIILISLYCCKEPIASDIPSGQPQDLRDDITTVDTFRYKELMEGYVDTVQEKEIPGFYGTWRITAIANVGGTILDEKRIKSQIGKKLILTADSVWKNFLEDTSSSKDPEYSLEYLNTDDGGRDLRGTTYAFGYRDCRKNVIFLRTSGTYLEVIHFGELAVYYDGRIYFFTKEE